MATLRDKIILALTAIILGVGTAAADEVKLTFVTIAPPNSHVAKTIFHPFAERINAAGKGTVHLDTRDGFALANLRNVYSRVMDNVVQVGWALQNAIGGKFVMSGVAGLPFVSDSCEQASVALWRLYKKGALAKEYADIVPLALVVFPQSGVHLAKAPANPENFAGVKLVALGKIQSSIVAKMGAVPISVPLTDVYTALQRGTADGALASWTTFDPFRLNEVTRYHVETRLGASTGMLFMSKKRYESLPPAARKVIDDNSGEKMSRIFGAFLDKEVIRIRNKVKASARDKVVEPSDALLAKLRQNGMVVDEEWTKSHPGGAALLTQYKALLAKAAAK